VFLFSKPSDQTVRSFIEAAAGSTLSYTEQGSTDGELPSGYNIDHNRIELGSGDQAWESARFAVRSWKMFDFPWVNLYFPNTPIEVDRNVAILVHHLGFYSLNAARIVYTIDEPDRFGFAYGTLAEHGESGEERFMVERGENGNVFYDLLAFSKPASLFAMLGYPYTRQLQKAFATDSKKAMLQNSHLTTDR
jgi:uncharacterized protein (UPF0548 family)